MKIGNYTKKLKERFAIFLAIIVVLTIVANTALSAPPTKDTNIINTPIVDITTYYRGLGQDPSTVETSDLLKAADDWRNNVVPPGFSVSIATGQLLTLADEWRTGISVPIPTPTATATAIPTPSPTSTPSPTPTPVSSPTPTPVSSPKVVIEHYPSNISRLTKYILSNGPEYQYPSPGMEFMIINLRITNEGYQLIQINKFQWVLKVSTKDNPNAYVEATKVFYGEIDGIECKDTDLKSGGWTICRIPFEIPANSDNYILYWNAYNGVNIEWKRV